MKKLNSVELKNQVNSAGIKYIPAEQVFYNKFPYKVELSPRFKGLGGVSGRRSCQIDISDPIKGRQKLSEFNKTMEKIFSNVEYRQEIRDFVDRLPNAEFKTRMGGENSLFYFRDPEIVMILVDRYREVINSVTGPISDNHQETMDDRNIVMREKLYYGRYRYMLEFPFTEDFVPTARVLLDYLRNLNQKSWRASKLELCINHYDYHDSSFTRTRAKRIPARKLGSPMTRPGIHMPFRRMEKIHLYLEDGNDYIYIKMLASEYTLHNHEVVLFDELT